jgi:hypothetical protein
MFRLLGKSVAGAASVILVAAIIVTMVAVPAARAEAPATPILIVEIA